MKKVVGITLFFYILIFSFPQPILAAKEHLNYQELNLLGFSGYEQINSNSLLYPFKRLQEKIFSKPQEALFDTRFNELVYIANFRKTNFLEETITRYNSITGEVMLQNIPKKDKVLKYIKILEKLRDGYPADSLPWIQIKQALETTQRLI